MFQLARTAKAMPSTCPKCSKQFPGPSIGTHALKCGVTPADLFWSKVAKGPGCWLWTASRKPRGYGHVRIGNRDVNAHRYAYELRYGPIQAGMEVMHVCDTPACVRPDHLRLGTHAENMADCKAKDRHAKGRMTKKSTLPDEIVRAIRAEYVKHHPKKGNGRELAKKYGVTPQVVCLIASGRTWRHVK